MSTDSRRKLRGASSDEESSQQHQGADPISRKKNYNNKDTRDDETTSNRGKLAPPVPKAYVKRFVQGMSSPKASNEKTCIEVTNGEKQEIPCERCKLSRRDCFKKADRVRCNSCIRLHGKCSLPEVPSEPTEIPLKRKAGDSLSEGTSPLQAKKKHASKASMPTVRAIQLDAPSTLSKEPPSHQLRRWGEDEYPLPPAVDEMVNEFKKAESSWRSSRGITKITRENAEKAVKAAEHATIIAKEALTTAEAVVRYATEAVKSAEEAKDVASTVYEAVQHTDRHQEELGIRMSRLLRQVKGFGRKVAEERAVARKNSNNSNEE